MMMIKMEGERKAVVDLTRSSRIADSHHRFGAFIIDWHIRTIPLALWGFWVLFQWFPGYWRSARLGSVGLDVAWQYLLPVLENPGVGVAGWLCFAAYLLYHPVVELAMRGDSPGKRMMGVTVRSLDGERPTVRQILVRNAWRAIEFLPFAYAWGVYAILHSVENARTGDVRSRTRVVMK